MSAGGPEWIVVHVFNVVQYSPEGPRKVKLRVGLVRMPLAGDVRIASQADDGDIFVLPPAVVAEIIGVLRKALSQL